MGKHVLSIEFHSKETKIVEIDYKRKNPHVYKAMTFETPEGCVEDGFIKDKDKLVLTLRSKLADLGIKETATVFTLASSKIATREITIPMVSKGKIMDVISATAQEYFPVNLSEYTMAYNKLEVLKEGKTKSLRLLILAAPNTLLNNYYAFAAAAGLTVESIDYFGHGSIQVLKKQIPAKCCVTVQFGPRTSMVNIINNGIQVIQRIVPMGVDDVTDAMLEGGEYSVATSGAAFDMLCRDHILYSTLDYESLESAVTARMTDEQWKDFQKNQKTRQLVTNAVGDLIMKVIRVIDYFSSKYSTVKLEAIYVTGMGVRIRGITTLFSNETGIPCHRIEFLSGVSFDKRFANSINDQTEYVAVIGAAIDPIGFRLQEMKKEKNSEANLLYARIFLGVMIAASAGLIATSIIQKTMASQRNADLQAEKDRLSYIDKIYNENDMAKSEYNNVVQIDNSTKSQNEKLNTLLKDIEKALPEDVELSFFSSDKDNGVSMTLTSKKKISVAKLIVDLSKVKGLVGVQVPAITSGSSSHGESYVFSVSAVCTYNMLLPQASTSEQ